VKLCLVTDRRRLAPETTSFRAARGCVLDQARYAVEAGIDLIQLRERDLSAADLAALARDLLLITRGTATRLVINDRLDVALACGSDGVHLRSDSVPARAARRMAPRPFLIGRSVHNVREAADAAGDADYLVAGTVFSTASKGPAAPLLGLKGLQSIVQAVSIPVLAIGGLVPDRAEQVARTGACGIAGIGLFMGDTAGGCRAVRLTDVVGHIRHPFDTHRRDS
jgi:thiamine-phosphate pyrophosphorylase